MKILLVDDDSFLRDMYATKFIESGDDVQTAKNGIEALEMLSKSKFDVVLTDIFMLGMDGMELLSEIQKRKIQPDCKYIVLSNNGEESDIEEATKAGADGYIIKSETLPFEVVHKVHNIIK